MEDFDMRPFCKEPEDHEEKNEIGEGSTIYDLYALIHHKGAFGGESRLSEIGLRSVHILIDSMHCLAGHYVTYAKNPIDKNWYEFDDTVSITE